jgi:hypothetical protein
MYIYNTLSMAVPVVLWRTQRLLMGTTIRPRGAGFSKWSQTRAYRSALGTDFMALRPYHCGQDCPQGQWSMGYRGRMLRAPL